MVPVNHPEYRGFDLTEMDHPKTSALREVAEKLDRCGVDASYECYQVMIYSHSESMEASPSQVELLNVPKAKRARIAEGNNSEGVDCTSPEEAVKTWLRRRAATSTEG